MFRVRRSLLAGLVALLGLLGIGGGIAIGTRNSSGGSSSEPESVILDPNTTDPTLVFLEEMIGQWNGLQQQNASSQASDERKIR